MIPKPLLEDILEDPFYKKCIRNNEGTCKGRITFEHAIIYAGKQVQEKWAIVPCCAFHHEVDEFQDNGDLNKELNQLAALKRATEEDFAKYPKRSWRKELYYLWNKHERTT